MLRRLLSRTAQPVTTTAAIRQQLATATSRRAALRAERQQLGLSAYEGDAAAIARRAAPVREIATLDGAMATLEDARPHAERREAEARTRERDRVLAELRAEQAGREQTRDALLATLRAAVLPTIEQMRELLALNREVSEIAHCITSATGEPFERLDVLDALRFSEHQRHIEFTRRLARVSGAERPDFADRPWQQRVLALRALQAAS